MEEEAKINDFSSERIDLIFDEVIKELEIEN